MDDWTMADIREWQKRRQREILRKAIAGFFRRRNAWLAAQRAAAEAADAEQCGEEGCTKFVSAKTGTHSGQCKGSSGGTETQGSGNQSANQPASQLISKPAKPPFDAEAERGKITSGEYPSKIKKGLQRGHIEGTKEFAQKSEKMDRETPGSKPAILNKDVEPQELVDKYKGTGIILYNRGSKYPKELIKENRAIGQSWVKSLGKYVDTNNFEIVYSSDGTHIRPVSPRK